MDGQDDVRVRRRERGGIELPDLDYVTLVAVVVLGILGSIALFTGNNSVAGAAAGAIGGLVTRLYR